MTNEERDLITQFIRRVSGADLMNAPSGGSVPATVTPLPPVDREADQYIGNMLVQYPEARYRLTQTAFVQEHALVEAQNRIKRLEWELGQTRQALQQAQAAAHAASNQSQGGGGFFGGLFGGRSNPQPPPPPPGWNQGAPQPGYGQPGYGQTQGYPQQPPPPQYPPNYQPGMLPRQGSGFLGSALTTTAGVAGGMVVGNALTSLFSPHVGGGLFGGGTETIIVPEALPPSSPWGGGAAPGQGGGFVDQSGWTTPDNSGGGDSGWSDPGGSSGWDTGSGGDWGGGSSDDTF